MKGNKGNRYSTEKLQELIGMWLRNVEMSEICRHYSLTPSGLNKLVLRLRKNGIPLPLRKNGHKPGRYNKNWTQEEVETVIRMRNERTSTADIAQAMDRSFYGVQALILKLRNEEDIPVVSLGRGMRRLWDPQRLRDSVAGRGLIVVGGTNT